MTGVVTVVAILVVGIIIFGFYGYELPNPGQSYCYSKSCR